MSYIGQTSYHHYPNFPAYSSSYMGRPANRSLPPFLNEYPEYPPPPIYYNRQYSRMPTPQFINHPSEIRAINNKSNVNTNNFLKEEIKEELGDHGNFFKEPSRTNKTDFDIFINAMKEQIILLRDLEKTKEKLAVTEEFNIDYLYKQFDSNFAEGSKSISLKEFKEALNNKFKVPASEKESYLIIRQYSSSNRLTRDEFEKLILPKSGFMEKKLQSPEKEDHDYTFKPETLGICSTLFDIHLKLESTWEKLKKKLQSRKTNLKNLFNFLDSDQNTSIESSDLKIVLEKNFLYPSKDEYEFVFSRFDQNKNKQITFMEFLTELTTTKSPPVMEKLSEFIKVIKTQMEVEKKIEQKKSDLIKLRDFDWEKVYKIFDENESGSVSFLEFKIGLEKFDITINPSNEDAVGLLFQTFNINDDNKLTKQEFKKMIFPSDTHLFQKLIFQPGGLSKKNDGSYRSLLTTIFELLLKGESEWAKAKKTFAGKVNELKLLFKEMDYDKDGMIQESDFKAFLQETAGFVASSSEIFALIRRFDRNGDCNIDEDEFLSELSKGLRKPKIQEDFSDEIISLFKEVKSRFKEIEKARSIVLKRYDFNPNEIKSMFDADSTGSISIHELKNGFNLFGLDVQDKQCYLICRRFSETQKYCLNYEEFEDIFKLHANIRKKIDLPGKKYLSNYLKDALISRETTLHLNSLFTLLINFEIFWDAKKSDFQTKKIDLSQLFKALDINKDKQLDESDISKFCSKNELNLEKDEISFILFLFDPKRTKQITQETFQKEFSPIEKFDEVAKKVGALEEISNILREITKVCREIEANKQSINQHEFNIKELFMRMDSNGSGVLTKDELLEGFQRLNLEISDSDCRILMREYCLDDDLEIMNFKSFRQMFTPVNSVHSATSLNSSRIETLTKEDLRHVSNFMKNLVRSERKIEKLRQTLMEKKVDLLKIFKILDAQNDGFLSGDDFIKFLMKNDISSNKTDINLIVSRFDKDKSQTISREEFVSELLPTPASYGDKGDISETLKSIFTEQLIRLNVLEKRKVELIKTRNFRIYELFNVLDESKTAVISNIEFRSLMYEYFEIKSTWEEINLLIYKYSSKKDELVLNLEDFKKMFIPVTIDYNKSEAFSKPVGKARGLDDKLKVPIAKFFRYLLNYEIFMNILRKELMNVDLQKLFSLVNVKKSPTITWEAFKDFIIKHGISESEEDAQLLFSVYDVNHDGRISEREFVSEYKPRDLSSLFLKKHQNSDYLKTIFLEMKRSLGEIEKWKENLSERKDFRILNLYQKIDENESGQLTKNEILRFFRRNGIMTNENLITLLIKRYSLDHDDLMSYEEFCLMFYTNQKTFARLTDSHKYNYEFDKETWKIIKKCLQALSEGEAEIEILRKNIRESNINIGALFRLMDSDDKGKISIDKFAHFLKSNKIIVYNRDIKNLIKRFDKANTSFITLQAFTNELNPTKA